MPRNIVTLGLCCAMLALSLPAVAETGAVPTWPTTRVADVAKGWVTAFNGGEASMREFARRRLPA